MAIFDVGVAVVTGAASGIGRATAIAFARDGCKKIVLGDLSNAGMGETRQIMLAEFPDTAVATRHLDVSDEASVEDFYSFAVSEFGSIDYAANIAGIAHEARALHKTPDNVFDKVYAVNQRGAFLCEREVLRQMLTQPRRNGGIRGSIVVVTSQLAEMTTPNMTAYSATKAGVRGMCRSDAMDYGPEGIRINTVGPGVTITPLLLAAQEDKFIQSMARGTPLRRNALPEDIANAIVWLSSSRASFITGVSLIVDGGMGLEVGPDEVLQAV
ncbi:hypothetical protein H2200_001292 [Cladophialophora chaetospira]|uniref:Uncharacterized protein n=1 Tax=Cladophialophora chaetospira TaxID=386627 RepID=A0AA39CMX1_9EURO|nr:hypothetical protein H2200_001292 [Cladophialophora chaetospira]